MTVLRKWKLWWEGVVEPGLFSLEIRRPIIIMMSLWLLGV